MPANKATSAVMMASLERRLSCKPLSSSYLSRVPRNLPRHDVWRFRKPMACVMEKLKLESAGTAKQQPLTVEPMFLLPRRFGLMFLAWLAARSGLTAQCLCSSATVFEIAYGEKSHWPQLDRSHGKSQILLGLAGVWPSMAVREHVRGWPLCLPGQADQPRISAFSCLVALVFTLPLVCRTLCTMSARTISHSDTTVTRPARGLANAPSPREALRDSSLTGRPSR